MHPALVAGIWAGALLLSAVGGWLVTRLVLHLASRSRDAGRRHADPQGPVLLQPLRISDGPTGEGARTVLRGGTWIGILERLVVTGSLLAGVPEGIAVAVAVKGLGRYPELRENPGASERFVIGTFASFVWSGTIGVIGTYVLVP